MIFLMPRLNRMLRQALGLYGLDFAPSPPKSAARVAWEALHRIFGFGILGVAWYQCSTGLDKYEQDIGTSLFPNAERFMWLVVGGFGGVVVILFYIQTTCRR